MGPRLQQLLNPAIAIPLGSLSPEDEIHLILEYGAGDTWGAARAPVATRFITSYDEANGQAVSLERFFSSIEAFSPDLVVVTGLHMVESQPEPVWAQRLGVLHERLQGLPDDLPVHMELASMVDPHFMRALITEVRSA